MAMRLYCFRMRRCCWAVVAKRLPISNPYRRLHIQRGKMTGAVRIRREPHHGDALVLFQNAQVLLGGGGEAAADLESLPPPSYTARQNDWGGKDSPRAPPWRCACIVSECAGAAGRWWRSACRVRATCCRCCPSTPPPVSSPAPTGSGVEGQQ